MMLQKKIDTLKMFNKALTYIINILIIYIIIILTIGLGKTLYSIKTLLCMQQINQGFAQVVTDILTFLVIIELFRSFIDYFKAKRFRLHSMIDPLIVFIIRELIVNFYTHDGLAWKTLVGFGILILSLGIVRTLAVFRSPQDEAPLV